MFVITTGKQTTDQGGYPPLDEVSTRIQSKGSAVFVLGIGKDVDPSELNQIASGPNNVFKVDSFEDLEEKADELKKGICVKGISLLCLCLRSLDFRKLQQNDTFRAYFG